MVQISSFAAAPTGGLSILLQGRDTRWWKGSLGQCNLVISLLIVTMATCGFDGSMMNNLQTLEVWADYFDHPHGSLLGLFNAIQSIGGIAGLPFAPYCTDTWGRRKTIFLGASIMLVGVVLQTAAQNIGMFIGCRFLIGFGLSFAANASPSLISELAFPTHRAPLTSLYNTMWYLGSIIAAWATYGTFHISTNWAWRIPSLMQGIPSMLQVLFIFTIPESPRWLVYQGREEEARAILCKYHCGGDDNDPLLDFEMQEIKESIRIDKEVNASSSWKSLFTDPSNRKRMRLVIATGFFSQWSGNGLVSYYLNLVLTGVGVTSTGSQLLFNGVLQVYNLVTAAGGALTVDKFGRRKLWLTSTAGMLFAYILWTIGAGVYAGSTTPTNADGSPMYPNLNAGHLVMAMILVYYGFYNIAMSALLVSYTVEIMPFAVRSKGLMVNSLCINAALTLNQYANPLAIDALGWKYYIVYVCWLAVELVFLWFYVVETKGENGILSLEEIARLFDGPEKVQQVSGAGIGEIGVTDDKNDEEKLEIAGDNVVRAIV